jgi:hypothetical protein
MQLHKRLLKFVFGKAALAAIALGGSLFFAGAPSAQAGQVYAYQRPVVRYEVRHGYYSPAANYWRYERRDAFAHGWRDRFGRWHRF